MGPVALFTVLSVLAFALTYAAPVQNDRASCIIMSPAKQKQIKYIEKKITELLLKLENETEDIIITDVNVNLKQYSELEAKKYINLNMSVNDCANSTTVGENLVYFEKPQIISYEKQNKNDANKQPCTTETSNSKPIVEVKLLELDDNEQKFVQVMEKKQGNRPFWLIKRNTGERDIFFLQ